MQYCSITSYQVSKPVQYLFFQSDNRIYSYPYLRVLLQGREDAVAARQPAVRAEEAAAGLAGAADLSWDVGTRHY